jgi:nicotinamidase-related amidase
MRMPRSNDLHGSVPDEHPDALLIIDLISDFDFPDGAKLLRKTRALIEPLRRVRTRANAASVPVIYVNDNRGRWRSDRSSFVAHCAAPQSQGRELAQALQPESRDYFVFKPKHSAFYATPLEALLKHLGTQRLILAGVTLEQCILMTAIEAYLRDYELFVLNDCVTGLRQCDAARRYLKQILHATLKPSRQLRFRPGKNIASTG